MEAPGAPPASPNAKLTSVPTSTAVPPVSQLPSLSGEGTPGQTPVAQMPSLNTGGESAPATAHPAAPAPAAKPEPAKDGSKTAASAPILSKVSPSKLLDMIQSK